MRTWLIVSLVLIAALPAMAPAQESTRTDADVLTRAESAFREGVEHRTRPLLARKRFAEAADGYLDLHRRGVRTPALYQNLGNAAALADRWPEAIWAYRVGLHLDPNDRHLREQLAFVRAKVLYPAAGQGRLDSETWPAWLHRPTSGEMFCVFAIAYVLSWIAGAGAFLWRSRRLWLCSAFAGAIALVAAFGMWHGDRQAKINRETPPAVIAENTLFYLGNASSYPQHMSVPMLPRGLEVRQIQRRGVWVQIRLNSGEVGWLPRNQVLLVEP